MLSKKVLALDVGKKKIGVAISDILGISANPSGFINASNTKKALDNVGDFIKENDIGTVVVGLPQNMDGTIGPQAEHCISFGKQVADLYSIDVVWQDERLSTREAERMLIESGMSRSKRKVENDQVAAAIILRSYLDRLSMSNSNNKE